MCMTLVMVTKLFNVSKFVIVKNIILLRWERINMYNNIGFVDKYLVYTIAESLFIFVSWYLDILLAYNSIAIYILNIHIYKSVTLLHCITLAE